LYQALQTLGLRGMARQFSAQLQNTDLAALPFNDRMALLLDAEQSERSNCRYAQRLRWAKLGQSASLEDLDQRTPRGLDKSLVTQLATLAFVEDKRNLLITGPTGVGKSYLACAIGQHACRHDISVRYLRMPRLVEELVRADALKRKGVTDRPKGATEDRRNGATFGWVKRDSNGVSGCGVFGVFCNC